MPGHNTENITFKQPELQEKYTCPKCLFLLKNAVQTCCGHWLCETCAEDIYKDRNPCCPKEDCGERFSSDDEYFPDRFVRKEIQNLLISCPNSRSGCGWEGKFRELEEHLPTECQHHLKEEVTKTEQDDDGIEHELDFGEDAKLESVEIDSPTASKVIALLMREIRAKDEEIASLKAKIQRLENEGTLLWPISQVSQKLDDPKTGGTMGIFSPPFYTGHHGYKMCLRVYLSGDGNGNHNHVSLFFVLMKGEFDNILQWPFKHKFTFKLINQCNGKDLVQTFQPDPTSSSFRKPKSDMNIASGCPRFVSHAVLNNGGFVKDDTIFIKCIVDTSTIRPP